jgi:hypothetical protein
MVTPLYQSGRDVDLRTRLLRLSPIWGRWNGVNVDGGRTASIANLTRFTACLATRGASTDASGKAGDATPGHLTIMERGPVDVVVLSRRRECACGMTASSAVAIGTPLVSAGAEALTLRVVP